MVSNKTLAAFLVVAVVLSVTAQFYSISRITQMKQGVQVTPTGYASRTGQVNFTILAATDISLYNATVDFGTGVVNSSNLACGGFANITNNGSGSNLNNCWANDTYADAGVRPNSPVTINASKILIKNDGNVNVSIIMTSVRMNAGSFIGNCTTGSDNWYQYTVYRNNTHTDYGCPSGQMDASGWRNVSGATDGNTICNETAWEDTSDSLLLAFNLSICATNNVQGLRDDTLTITSAAAS